MSSELIMWCRSDIASVSGVLPQTRHNALGIARNPLRDIRRDRFITKHYWENGNLSSLLGSQEAAQAVRFDA